MPTPKPAVGPSGIPEGPNRACGLQDGQDCASCGHLAPAWLREPPGLTTSRSVKRSEALRGWRIWAVKPSEVWVPTRWRDGEPSVYRVDEGPLELVGPYKRPFGAGQAAAWQPGVNHAASDQCAASECAGTKHPHARCSCGIRAMTDRAGLLEYHQARPGRHVSSVLAVGPVDVWGTVAGPVIGDDWPGTVRASRCSLAGDLTVLVPGDGIPTHWRIADLETRYAVTVVSPTS